MSKKFKEAGHAHRQNADLRLGTYAVQYLINRRDDPILLIEGTTQYKHAVVLYCTIALIMQNR